MVVEPVAGDGGVGRGAAPGCRAGGLDHHPADVALELGEAARAGDFFHAAEIEGGGAALGVGVGAFEP